MKRFVVFVLILSVIIYNGCKQKINTGNENAPGNYKPKQGNGKQISQIITGLEILRFSNGLVYYIEGAIEYVNGDTIKIYEIDSKEADYFITHENVFLIKIEENPGWFYSISDNAEALGYVYIYDISEKSFYGDFEKNKESGNGYRMSLKREYDIIKRHQNIKRYGPLLIVNYNNNLIEFWDTFTGINGKKYLIFDYYPEFNEILIDEYYHEGGNTGIYNLEHREYRCSNLGYWHVYFNESRTYMVSLGWSYDGGPFAELKIFRIENGFYDKIYDEEVIGLSGSINNVLWLNNHEAYIDCGEIGMVLVEISDKVEVKNNLKKE
jgi:hypothetical protein